VISYVLTVVFDNWRVLHGRKAFTGERRICGAYITRDAFRSRYLTTNVEREKLLFEI
jgi:trimethyllysine dioxygenase